VGSAGNWSGARRSWYSTPDREEEEEEEEDEEEEEEEEEEGSWGVSCEVRSQKDRSPHAVKP
jgi:hypothetical protein